MMIGQTVWYRVSQSDVYRVFIQRERIRVFGEAGWDDEVTTEMYEVNHGDAVTAGELLPADVIRIYSHQDLGTQDDIFPELAHSTFGGVADIRVKLPGNDDLYLPKARMDNETGQTVKYGVGTMYLPPHGTFTIIGHSELTNY